MKILVIQSGGRLRSDVESLVDRKRVSVVEVSSPIEAVEYLTINANFDLVVVSMASVWGGSSKWDSVVQACGKRVPCIFIPDTCEIGAISGVVLNNQVVCPINTLSGKRFFSAIVSDVLESHYQSTASLTPPSNATINSLAAQRAKDSKKGECTHIGAPKLTKRQKEIIKLILEGLSNREIAQRLNLAEGTIKVHSITIYRLLGVSNRVQAVLRAQKFAACF